MSKKKNRIGVVYSTDPDFVFKSEEEPQPKTLLPGDQLLYISLDKKQRKGKKVTLVENFIGKEEDLQILSKTLKSKCGSGGSAKDGVIIIQGDFRDRIENFLQDAGFKTRKRG